MDKFESAAYWVELILKGGMGVVFAIISWDYRNVKSHLEELQTARYEVGADVAIVQSEVEYIKESVDRIDRKIDKMMK